VCVAGGTTLPQFAALLAACQFVLCNDSGGMHLAAAVGTPVVAVFGVTDAARTGPLGSEHTVVRREDVQGDRAVSRNSRTAEAVLASIGADRVVGVARKLLRRPPRSRFAGAAEE
jgi:ADP-heptose:LPS heptosyltransferase